MMPTSAANGSATVVCLTPAHVERVLRDAGFRIEGTDVMLPGITMLIRASKRA
jgi:hypothetical protein